MAKCCSSTTDLPRGKRPVCASEIDAEATSNNVTAARVTTRRRTGRSVESESAGTVSLPASGDVETVDSTGLVALSFFEKLLAQLIVKRAALDNGRCFGPELAEPFRGVRSCLFCCCANIRQRCDFDRVGDFGETRQPRRRRPHQNQTASHLHHVDGVARVNRSTTKDVDSVGRQTAD